ncbi:MAG: LEPR-XLL domain-containing protein [Betaproteobacteria bacterium]|nr:LEPR-XLL domain-containing protein [Betaproteobacteria bacterium]
MKRPRPQSVHFSSAARPPFARKALFERLEPRILLSADAPGLVDSAGLLAIQLGDAGHEVVVTRTGDAQNGGALLRVDIDGSFWDFGDAADGVTSLRIDGGAGDDRIDASGAAVTTTVDGGAGQDSLVGPRQDVRWSLTGDGAGAVGGVTFSRIENLLGAADNRDTFVLFAGGGLSGTADGGSGGFDSLEIDAGPISLARFLADGPDSGVVELDGDTFRYAGLEPITLTSTAGEIVVDATSDDNTLVLEADPTNSANLRVRSTDGTIESVSFARASTSITINLLGGDDSLDIGDLGAGITASLTVDGGDGDTDLITVSGDVVLPGKDVSLSAETVTVAYTGSLSVRTTAAGADQETAASTGGSGNIALLGQNVVVAADARLLSQDTRAGQASAAISLGTVAGDWTANKLGTQTVSGTWTRGLTHRLVGATSTSGSGDGMVVDISVDASGNVSATLVDIGEDYVVGDTVTFDEPDRNPDGGDDLSTNGSVTFTLVASHKGVRPAETSGDGEGMTVDIDVDASGTLTVSMDSPGARYAVNDTVTFNDPLETFDPFGQDNTAEVTVTAWAGNILVEGRHQFTSASAFQFYDAIDTEPLVTVDGATLRGENITIRAVANSINEPGEDEVVGQTVDDLGLGGLDDLNAFFGMVKATSTAQAGVAAAVVTSGLTQAGTWTGDLSHARVAATSTSGSGTGMLADIEVDGDGLVTITVVNPGTGYQAGDTVTFSEPGEDADGEALSTNGTISVRIDLWQPTIIRAEGDVNVEAWAGAKADLLTGGVLFGLGLTFATVDATAYVAGGADITSGGALRVQSLAENISDMAVNVTSARSIPTLSGGYAAARSIVDAHVDSGALLSVHSLDVLADTQNDVNATVVPLELVDAQSSGMAVTIAVIDSDTTAFVDAAVTVPGDVSVVASTEVENENTAAAEPSSATGGILGAGFGAIKNKISSKSAPAQSGAEKFEFSAGIAVTLSDNDSTAYIGSNADVKAGGDVTVDASVYDDLRISATSTAEDAQTGISVSVAVAETDDHATAYIADDARVNSRGALTVHSSTVIPNPLPDNAWGVFAPDADTGAGAIFSVLKSTINFESLMFSLFTSYVRSGAVFTESGTATSGGSGTTAPESKLSLAGSFNWLEYDNASHAYIGAGAQINQDAAYRADGQTVSVTADSKIKTLNVVGIFSFPNPANAIGSDGKTSQALIDSINPLGNSGKAALGGSLTYLNYGTSTIAEIKEGAVVYARQGTTVRSKSDHWTFMLSVAGGKAEKTGVEGAFGMVDQTSVTRAQVHDGATVTGGGLAILSTDDTSHLNVTGGAVWSKNVGVGFSIGVEDVDRTVEAVLGESDATATALATTVDVTGDVQIEAEATGQVESYSVAASLKTATDANTNQGSPTGSTNQSLGPSGSGGQQPVNVSGGSGSGGSGGSGGTGGTGSTGGTGGTGSTGGTGGTGSTGSSTQSQTGYAIAGDVSVNIIDDTARAVVNAPGTVKTGSARDLDVVAANTTDFVALAGAATFSSDRRPCSRSPSASPVRWASM